MKIIINTAYYLRGGIPNIFHLIHYLTYPVYEAAYSFPLVYPIPRFHCSIFAWWGEVRSSVMSRNAGLPLSGSNRFKPRQGHNALLHVYIAY